MFIIVIYIYNSVAPAVLLRGNSRNINIFFSVIIARKHTIGLIIQYVSFNTIEIMTIIIIFRPNIFTETRARTVFGGFDFSSCNLLAKTNNFKSYKQFFSLRRSSIVLSFRATETIFIGTRT
jgi:hypothetical protein